MRYGNASMLCMLIAGVVYGAAGGCGSGGDGSVFQTNGSLAGGTQAGGTQAGGSLAGGSLTGGIMTVGGAGTGSTLTGGGDPDAACAAQASDSNAIPSDIFIMLDKSGSMNCAAADNACTNPRMPYTHPTRWEAVSQAITGFVNAPGSAGIGVGIQFFSLDGAGCNVGAYSMPAVRVMPLPANAMAITNAISGQMPNGNTPTVPSLTGAINYAKTYTMNTPGRTASVVFVTDGLPNDTCGSSVMGAVTAAQNAFMGTPQIKTYVVGLGDVAALDQIALAGTGGATHYFPANMDVSAQLAAALTKISGTVSCDYMIPQSNVDPRNVNIQVAVGGGALMRVDYVGSAAMCGPGGGWYYDNPMKPTKITLCMQTCDPLKMTMGSKVQVLYGCPTVGPGVH